MILFVFSLQLIDSNQHQKRLINPLQVKHLKNNIKKLLTI